MRREIEVMGVLRVPPLGRLVVEVNDERYQTLDEIADGNLKRRLLAAIGELISFAGGYQNLVDAGVAPALGSPQAPQRQPEQERQPLSEAQARFLAQMEAERDALKADATPDDVEIEEETIPESTPEPETQAPASQPTSVAAQIDAILQELIAADNRFAERTIHLTNNPAGGLHIVVDGTYYNEPGEIEDEAVQQLIRTAVKQWRPSSSH